VWGSLRGSAEGDLLVMMNGDGGGKVVMWCGLVLCGESEWAASAGQPAREIIKPDATESRHN